MFPATPSPSLSLCYDRHNRYKPAIQWQFSITLLLFPWWQNLIKSQIELCQIHSIKFFLCENFRALFQFLKEQKSKNGILQFVRLNLFSGVRLKTASAIKVSFSLVSVVGFFLLVFSLSTEYSQWYISPKNCDLMGFFSLWGGQHLWAVCAKHMLGGKKAQMFEQINENIVCERNKSHAEIHILIPNWWLLMPQNSHRKKKWLPVS